MYRLSFFKEYNWNKLIYIELEERKKKSICIRNQNIIRFGNNFFKQKNLLQVLQKSIDFFLSHVTFSSSITIHLI